MKSSFHRIIAIGLLFTASIPFAFILSLQVKQHFIRYEMMEKMEKQLLQTIILPEKDVHWVKNKKEILVKGKMFDVKSFTIENGQYKFTGLFDEEETFIADLINNNLKKENQSGKLLLSGLFNWLQTVFSNNTENIIFISQSDPPQYGLFHFRLTSPFKTILTPPPQLY